ncbi:MAG: hypothetical protein Ta2B_12540 [Termitinemataceae bacterium]|nr:MAG: hypothetical protein Ta2B_12540 [Termitinemataceae bacterium]
MKKLKFFAVIVGICFLSGCSGGWKYGQPLTKSKIKIAFVMPKDDADGLCAAQLSGFIANKELIGLADNQIIMLSNIDKTNSDGIEIAIRGAILNGANLVIATDGAFMEICAKLSDEFKKVIFTCYGGDLFNDTNLTNYSARIYQAFYLCGIVAAGATKNNKIGVAYHSKENDAQGIYSDLNAFALGVERFNPAATIFPTEVLGGEAADSIPQTEWNRAAEYLYTLGCDLIEMQNGLWTYNNTNSQNRSVVTFIVFHWDLYYNQLLLSIIKGDFSTVPYYGGIAEGVIDINHITEITNNDIQNEISAVKKSIVEDGFNVFDEFWQSK